MTKPMTRWGVGPLWLLAWLAYGVVAYIVTRAYPVFRIPDALYPALTFLGILLLLIGFPYYLLSVYAVMRAFSAGRLVTNGVYSICRHPLYGSAIVFSVPGVAMLLHSWFVLTTPIVMYLLLRAVVAKEEDYLAAKFGESYRQYKAKVPFVCPVGWLIKKQ